MHDVTLTAPITIIKLISLLNPKQSYSRIMPDDE